MKSKTLKQFLAEKRKAEAQRPEAVMKTLETLTNVKDGSYYASAVIINITDLEGNVLADAAINGEQLDDLRVKVKTWDEIAAYTGVDFTEEEFHTLYGVVYDEANDDPIGLLDEMYDAAGKGEDTCLIVGGDTEDEFPTYHLRNLRTGQMVEREPRAPYQFRDWMLKLTR